MALLTKSLSLYERNEKAELIPQVRKLLLSEKDAADYPELVGSEVSIIPMTRGEVKELFGFSGKESDSVKSENRDNDMELILKYCKIPAYTREEAPAIKPVIVRSIVATILNESGVKIDEDTGKKRVNSEQDEFGKN